MRLGKLAGIGLCAFLVSRSVLADPVPSLDLRGFHPPTDPAGSLYLEPTKTPGPWAWNAGAWLSYARRPVTAQAGGVELGVPVADQLSLDYGFGLGIGERLGLGLSLPTVLYQRGTGQSAVSATPLPQMALGDVGLGLKATLVPPGELGGFGLAALGKVTFPTGNANGYVSEGGVTGELRWLAELKLLAVDVRASAGVKLRGVEETYLGQRFGHELPWGLGLVVRPQVLGIDERGRWQWIVEGHGALALAPEFGARAQSPALLGLSVRYKIKDSALLVGAELPLDSAVGVPTVRGVIGFDFAPRIHDADGDGVPDDIDQCPELPEDKDHFEDGDGCPDFDNDDDGVPDETDRCPTEKEDSDGFQDEDGCPDPDNDGDHIPDSADACPNEAGEASKNPKLNGCKPRDTDGDKILDSVDKCPTVPEDLDGFQDEDGCPDPDNDADGVLDADDACPLAPGPKRSDPKLNGCPSPDKDGDTFDDADDKCPELPEDFLGLEDGCPEVPKPAGKLAPVAVDDTHKPAALVVRGPIAFEAKRDELTAKSLTTVRALAELLNQRPGSVVLVGVRPSARTPAAEERAQNQAFAIVYALRRFTHRDEVAEAVRFAAVAQAPGAQARGIGFKLVE